MEIERKVDMIRIERAEEFYDREEIFGRNVSSVFPKQAEAAQSAGASLDAGSVKDALGARRFISETELEAIKASRGATADDGSVVPLKPLVEVLREAKERKEAEFQNKWKQMKQGKNRPLDSEELAFMDKLLEDEAEKERQKREFEESGLEEYRRAMQAAQESQQEASARIMQAEPSAFKRTSPSVAAKPVLKPFIKVTHKPKAGSGEAAAAQPSSSAPSASGQPSLKRPRSDLPDPDQEPVAKGALKGEPAELEHASRGPTDGGVDDGGLAGLLGGYSSED